MSRPIARTREPRIPVRTRSSPQPARQMLPHEIVVGEIGVLAVNAVDLLALAGAQALLRIEAPDALQQALAAQHFVTAGDAAAELVGDVEERRVAIGDPAVEPQQLAVDATCGLRLDRKSTRLNSSHV